MIASTNIVSVTQTSGPAIKYITKQFTTTNGTPTKVEIELLVNNSVVLSISRIRVDAAPANFGLLCKSHDNTLSKRRFCNCFSIRSFATPITLDFIILAPRSNAMTIEIPITKVSNEDLAS